MEPGEQYQVGDLVVYTPEGVITKIGGYVWSGIGNPQKIVAYELSCGISVSGEMLRRATVDDEYRVNPIAQEVQQTRDRIRNGTRLPGVRFKP